MMEQRSNRLHIDQHPPTEDKEPQHRRSLFHFFSPFPLGAVSSCDVIGHQIAACVSGRDWRLATRHPRINVAILYSILDLCAASSFHCLSQSGREFLSFHGGHVAVVSHRN